MVRMLENDYTKDKKSLILPIILFILGIVYGISPVDAVPDVVPVAGQLDDVVAVLGTGFNLIHKSLQDSNNIFLKFVSGFAKFAKWIIVILGIIAVGIILLLGVSIINLIKNW